MNIRRGLYLLIGCITLAQILTAQVSEIDIFQSNAPREIKQYGEDVMVHLIQGDNQMIHGNFNEALLAYNNAIAQSPYWAEAFLKRAIAKRRLGMNREAEIDFQKAMRLNPYVADLYGYPSNQKRRALLDFPVEQYLATANSSIIMEAFQHLVLSAKNKKLSSGENAA